MRFAASSVARPERSVRRRCRAARQRFGEKLAPLDASARFFDDPVTVDTGVPDPPNYPEVVDMGPYEFHACNPCDTNCDGVVNAFDIEPFLELLFGGGVPCDTCAGDVNGDSVIDAFDIEPFVECLFGP